MQRLIHCIAFSSLVAMASLAIAQPDGAALSLDLETAITHALAGNPSLKATGYQLRIQDARIDQAAIKPRPKLQIDVEDVLGSGANDMLRGVQSTASVVWILERGVRESLISSVRARSSIIESDIAIQRLDVAAETARRYIECLELQSRLVIATEGIELGAAAVTAIDQRVSVGSAPAADLARARANLRKLELVEENIEHELLSANYRLAAQWGDTEPKFNRVLGDLLDIPQIEGFTSFESRLDQNPDLERYLTVNRVNEAQLRFEQASNRQPWSMSAGFRWLNKESDHSFVASLSIPLGPEDSNRGRVAEARARITQTQLEREAQRLRLHTDLFVLYQELMHSVHLTASIEQDILPLYESALQQTQTAYEAGRYSYLEWSTSQIDLLSARNDLAEAASSIRHNLIEIERLTGVSVETPYLSQ
ncbi:MAG: cobalt-zinc-cadmium efflux system outer membrane protein [Pseudohongiellaceae bacterium]|jgi:cobalt-zinc-cadmium efflux system outer membrane protein